MIFLQFEAWSEYVWDSGWMVFSVGDIWSYPDKRDKKEQTELFLNDCVALHSLERLC